MEKGEKAAARGIKHNKQRDKILYNVLRWIYEDSVFVGEISQQYPQFPLLAGTLPISIQLVTSNPPTAAPTNALSTPLASTSTSPNLPNFDGSDNGRLDIAGDVSCDWDCSLHLPPVWVSYKEQASIEDKLDEWTEQLKASEADIASLAACLNKPLRPLWYDRNTVSLDKQPHHDSYDFTPIILVSASSWIHVSQCRTKSISKFSWHYIPGAGDREKSWAKGLSPTLFWNHVYDLIFSSPNVCNQKVIDIVERSKVHRAYTGETAPQIKIRPLSLDSLTYKEPSPASNTSNVEPSEGLAVSTSQFGLLLS